MTGAEPVRLSDAPTMRAAIQWAFEEDGEYARDGMWTDPDEDQVRRAEDDYERWLFAGDAE